MVSIARRRRTTNIWPGYVDALATLLMVLIFLLLIFVLAQVLLSEVLSGRNAALRNLQTQVDELAELLALEKESQAELQADVSRLTAQLQTSLAERHDLSLLVDSLRTRAESAEERAFMTGDALSRAEANIEERRDEVDLLNARLQVLLAEKTDLEDDVAEFTLNAEQAKAVEETLRNEIRTLTAQVVALQALKEDLEREANELGQDAKETETALLAERELSESARAQVALLTQQMAALRDQLRALELALEASERKAEEQNVQIQSLGRRLNAALATRVQELSRYRSEFFGRLREVLGNRQDIRIVGDRFIFQSEVLFGTGQAVLGEEGRAQILQVAETLLDVSQRIPEEIDWILQVEGHTDRVPINTPLYPSNWELSTARAISVIRLLLDSGIPADRLSAAGFGEFQPLESEDSETAYRRNRRIEIRLTQR
jgi:chemotaxis protein MotB